MAMAPWAMVAHHVLVVAPIPVRIRGSQDRPCSNRGRSGQEHECMNSLTAPVSLGLALTRSFCGKLVLGEGPDTSDSYGQLALQCPNSYPLPRRTYSPPPSLVLLYSSSEPSEEETGGGGVAIFNPNPTLLPPSWGTGEVGLG